MSARLWVMAALSTAAAAWLFRDGLEKIYATWFDAPEYSHGILIPFITAYLIWQRTEELQQRPFSGSWLGVCCVIFGLALLGVGELSAIYMLGQYALLIVLAGWFLSWLGWSAFRVVAVPLLILAFMIPLPQFLYQGLSAKLQLLSSELGVWVIRLFGISVFLEGNVIDLGTFKLQVVEACNGLRYLFPLMTLGFVMAYLYQASLWKRAVVFLSTIPITVLMNSFRIGVIGVTVEHWGPVMAEGFLHDFEGWVIFMACFSVLFIEMWLLMRLTGDRRQLRVVFGLDLPPVPARDSSSVRVRPVPHALTVAVLALLIAVVGSQAIPHVKEIEPPRAEFSRFPQTIDGWVGRSATLESVYIDALKFTDYLLMNYSDAEHHLINVYAAYYASQRKGESVHSPRSCLPGGGWQIESLTQVEVPVDGRQTAGLRINRVLISAGDQKQIVYYWFAQRGRVITNEYAVKWYLLRDALLRQRSDGALVRVTMPVEDASQVAEVDAVLLGFIAKLAPQLAPYLPD
jgi:exosortase D (VPLPA-CTERM-specific)